jgi:Flp pilus assembly protein TadD
MGDTEGARRAYEKALEVDANSAVAANNLAWILAEQGADMDRALDLARRARQQLPNLPGPADTLGWIYYKRGLVDSAVPLLQEAVKMQPDRGVYRFHLAAALLSAGKKDQARGALREALRLDASLKQRDDVQKLMSQM